MGFSRRQLDLVQSVSSRLLWLARQGDVKKSTWALVHREGGVYCILQYGICGVWLFPYSMHRQSGEEGSVLRLAF
ncbi:hypothetical protein DL98DRAFT_520760 [Cadophora sp. DSE1049]|nr:hypothetical protein DL98DRAFT_520760 [Cadophora sp. DSE1049]